jgi:hypothetical protein
LNYKEGIAVEIIKRIEGQKADKQRIPEGHPQISFNSDGRMVIRQIYFPVDGTQEDTLLVLDVNTTSKIIKFVQQLEAVSKDDGLPF